MLEIGDLLQDTMLKVILGRLPGGCCPPSLQSGHIQSSWFQSSVFPVPHKCVAPGWHLAIKPESLPYLPKGGPLSSNSETLLKDNFTNVFHQPHGINLHLNDVNSFAVLTLTNIRVVPGRDFCLSRTIFMYGCPDLSSKPNLKTENKRNI